VGGLATGRLILGLLVLAVSQGAVHVGGKKLAKSSITSILLYTI
jgi:hypothetical protein